MKKYKLFLQLWEWEVNCSNLILSTSVKSLVPRPSLQLYGKSNAKKPEKYWLVIVIQSFLFLIN